MYWIREITVNRKALTLSGTETAVFILIPVVKVLSSNSLDRIPTDTPVITFFKSQLCMHIMHTSSLSAKGMHEELNCGMCRAMPCTHGQLVILRPFWGEMNGSNCNPNIATIGGQHPLSVAVFLSSTHLMHNNLS